MGAPSSSIAPAVGCTRPTMALSVVLLPAPLAPSRVTMAPCGTVRLTDFRTVLPPYPASTLCKDSIAPPFPKISLDDRRRPAHFLGPALGDLGWTGRARGARAAGCR
ncbi:Uncharacterised protein [Bordetella pertussis]|nr:Uncharacterised protein [Bordetella pertussis]